MIENNSYLSLLDDNNYYCLLPNHTYKKIPHIEWVTEINWMLLYYDVYKGIIEKKISDDQVKDWDLEDIFRAIGKDI